MSGLSREGFQVWWFDGQHPRAHAAWLTVVGPMLVVNTVDGTHSHPLAAIRWPERFAQGQALVELPGGDSLQHPHVQELRQWWLSQGGRDAAVTRWQQNWRATFAALAGCLACAGAAWIWGIPLVSQAVVRTIPQSWEARAGKEAMGQIEKFLLTPTQLSAQKQQAIGEKFSTLMVKAHAPRPPPFWELKFYHAQKLGPNAFALPGGTVVLTDAIVQLLDDTPDALHGVLAHEVGHVVHRHGMDLLVRASLAGTVMGLMLGDAGALLASVPTVLVNQAYSREVERQADTYAAQTLDAAGIDPSVLTLFFVRITQWMREEGMNDKTLPIAIASHPDSAERMSYFNNWRNAPSRAAQQKP